MKNLWTKIKAAWKVLLVSLMIIGAILYWIAYSKLGDLFVLQKIFEEIGKVTDRNTMKECPSYCLPELERFAKPDGIDATVLREKLKTYPFTPADYEPSQDEYKALSYKELQDCLKGLSSEQINIVSAQLPQVVFNLVKRLQPLSEPPEYFDQYTNKYISFKEFRNQSYYWSALSRLFMHKKDYNSALACLAALGLTLNYVTAGSDKLPEYPQFEAASAMISYALSDHAYGNLIEFASDLELDSKRLKEWARIFKFLQDDYMAPERFFKSCKSTILSFFHLKNVENDEKMNKLYKKVNSPKTLDKFVNRFWDPSISACNMSLAEAKKSFDKIDKEYSDFLWDEGGLGYMIKISRMLFFQPHQYLAYGLGKLGGIPSFKSYETTLKYNRTVRAATIVLALKAYKQEAGNLPRSISELEKWIGFKFLPDPVTGESFLYDPASSDKILYSPASDHMSYKKDVIYMPLNIK